jgi:hypothetical protein
LILAGERQTRSDRDSKDGRDHENVERYLTTSQMTGEGNAKDGSIIEADLVECDCEEICTLAPESRDPRWSVPRNACTITAVRLLG